MGYITLNLKTLYIYLIIFLILLNSITSSQSDYTKLKPPSINKVQEAFSTSQCEIITDGPISLHDMERIILPDPQIPNLVGYWDFDTTQPIDHSGNKNHAIGKVKSGPALGGYGASAQFSNGNFITIPHTNNFPSKTFSLTFFVYFFKSQQLQKNENRYFPILFKGVDNIENKIFKRAPAVFYDRIDNNLLVFLSTIGTNNTEGEILISHSKLFPLKWFHIAIIKGEGFVSLYINGIKDNQMQLLTPFEYNIKPLYVGNVPWREEEKSFSFLIDELRYYNEAINEDYIQGEASVVLGGVEPSFIKIGCLNCNITQAAQVCGKIEGYQLCTSIELHAGGYQILRSLGLIDSKTNVWTHGTIEKSSEFNGQLGIGVCCSIIQ